MRTMIRVVKKLFNRMKEVGFEKSPEEVFDFETRGKTLTFTLFESYAAIRGNKRFFAYHKDELYPAEPYYPSVTQDLLNEVGEKIVVGEIKPIYYIRISAIFALHLYLEGTLTFEQIKKGQVFRRGIFSKEWVVKFDIRLEQISSPIRLFVIKSPYVNEEFLESVGEEEFPV